MFTRSAIPVSSNPAFRSAPLSKGLLNCPFMSRHSLLRDQGRAPGPRGTFTCKVMTVLTYQVFWWVKVMVAAVATSSRRADFYPIVTL